MGESNSVWNGNSSARPVKCTLVVPRRTVDNAILLAQKARGFGTGKWIGFGGKLQLGETVEDSALREVAEETGLILRPDQISKRALLLFSFECNPGLFIEVHVYETYAIAAVPALCDEFSAPPVWFVKDELPLKKMWADFAIWSPIFFQGERFRARFAYRDFTSIICSSIELAKGGTDELLAKENWTKADLHSGVTSDGTLTEK